MTDRVEGGHAFPTGFDMEVDMTLRDWFAGQALTGVMNRLEGIPESPEHAAKVVADMTYIIADAMLEARK